MSQEIIIKTDNSTYAEIIVQLARTLGLTPQVSPFLSENETLLQTDLKKTIEAGGDMSYITDPVEWQREVRKDRKLF